MSYAINSGDFKATFMITQKILPYNKDLPLRILSMVGYRYTYKMLVSYHWDQTQLAQGLTDTYDVPGFDITVPPNPPELEVIVNMSSPPLT